MIKIPEPVQEKILDGMKPQHRGIVRSHFNGLSPEQIAEDLSFSVPQVKLVLSDIATYVKGSTKSKKKIKTVKKAFDALESRDIPADELEHLKARAIEVIANALYSDKLNARQIDTAFKVLNRTGLHEKREELGGDKSLTFISYAPLPGDDPTEALKRAREIEDKKE